MQIEPHNTISWKPSRGTARFNAIFKEVYDIITNENKFRFNNTFCRDSLLSRNAAAPDPLRDFFPG